MAESRFQRAIAAIDAVNAKDPNVISVDDVERPKELVHAEMVTSWLDKLAPDATPELKLAGRAHHIERWILPRSEFSEGRKGYLAWRQKLQRHHAEVTSQILAEIGYPKDSIQRVRDIIRKKRLSRDAEVQAFEDALCLVFLETQLHEIADRLAPEKVIDVLKRTLPKMSPEGRHAALDIDLEPEDRGLLEEAIRGSGQS